MGERYRMKVMLDGDSIGVVTLPDVSADARFVSLIAMGENGNRDLADIDAAALRRAGPARRDQEPAGPKVMPSLSVTNEMAVPVAKSVVGLLLEQIEDGVDPALALGEAFSAGARFATSELVAQLIEAGIDVPIDAAND